MTTGPAASSHAGTLPAMHSFSEPHRHIQHLRPHDFIAGQFRFSRSISASLAILRAAHPLREFLDMRRIEEGSV
jgi:hypothetical protein